MLTTIMWSPGSCDARAEKRLIRVIGSATCIDRAATHSDERPSDFVPTIAITNSPTATWTEKGTYEFMLRPREIASPAVGIVFLTPDCSAALLSAAQDCTSAKATVDAVLSNKSCLVGATSFAIAGARFDHGQPYIYAEKARLSGACSVSPSSVANVIASTSAFNAMRAQCHIAGPEPEQGVTAGGAALATGTIALLVGGAAAAGVVGGIIVDPPPEPPPTVDYPIDSLKSGQGSSAPFFLGIDVANPGVGMQQTASSYASHAALWNASALASSLQRQAAVYAGPDYAEVGVGMPVGDRGGVGVSYVALRHTRLWTATFDGGREHAEDIDNWDQMAAVGGAFRMSDKLALGLSVRLLSSASTTPTLVREAQLAESISTTFVTEKKTSTVGDVDLSATWQPTTHLTFGASIQSLLDQPLRVSPNEVLRLQGGAFGVRWQTGRVLLGAELTASPDRRTGWALGLYVRGPWHTRATAGAAVYGAAYSGVAVGVEWFGLSYRWSRDTNNSSNHVFGAGLRF
jgi:hypothetical protein